MKKIEQLQGSALNAAKAVLAFETTLLAHGREETQKAHQAAASMFGSKEIDVQILPSSSIPRGGSEFDDVSVPESYVDMDKLKVGIPAFKLFHTAGLASSGGAARRLIEQGGAYVNGHRIDSFDFLITDQELNDANAIILRSGKKRFHKIKSF